eukprot:COSAG01_NODE_318_length_18932_cov_26.063983_14_plen_80_part_00
MMIVTAQHSWLLTYFLQDSPLDSWLLYSCVVDSVVQDIIIWVLGTARRSITASIEQGPCGLCQKAIQLLDGDTEFTRIL